MPFRDPHPLYSVWQGMKRRCDNPNFKQFADYGGRGIRVCDRWLHSFANFASDMGDRPPGYTLDRVDNDGPYSPENCRWASRSEQQRNRRQTRMVEVEGQSYCVADLAERSGQKGDIIVLRAARGLPLSEVIAPQRHPERQNWRKAVAARIAVQAAATHCKYGHPWTPENTRITPQGWKNCRTCQRNKMRLRYAAARLAKEGNG